MIFLLNLSLIGISAMSENRASGTDRKSSLMGFKISDEKTKTATALIKSEVLSPSTEPLSFRNREPLFILLASKNRLKKSNNAWSTKT